MTLQVAEKKLKISKKRSRVRTRATRDQNRRRFLADGGMRMWVWVVMRLWVWICDLGGWRLWWLSTGGFYFYFLFMVVVVVAGSG